MKIYDISQEVFGCVVFPGDPAPKKETLYEISKGNICNLTAFSMCAHNGTHIDAPYHFIDVGDTIEKIPLYKTVGMAYVLEHAGNVTADDAETILDKATSFGCDAEKRILIKGNAVVTLEAAEVFAKHGIYLVGNESQTVGPEDGPMEVHKVLLGAKVVLLEGIRLAHVPDGVYLLSATPLSLAGADGSPCRAVLVEM